MPATDRGPDPHPVADVDTGYPLADEHGYACDADADGNAHTHADQHQRAGLARSRAPVGRGLGLVAVDPASIAWFHREGIARLPRICAAFTRTCSATSGGTRSASSVC